MNKDFYASLLLLLFACTVLGACTVQPFAMDVPAGSNCTDAIGCVDIAQGEPLYIGYALAVLGAEDTIALDSINGIEIALEDKSQIIGHDILLTGEEEQCKPEGGVNASTKLAANQDIIAVISIFCSDAAQTGVPILSQAGLTIVSPANTEFDLTQTGNEDQYPGYARTAHDDIVQGQTAAEFAFDVLGSRKVATIQDGSLNADKLQGIFVESFEQMGGTVTLQETIDPSETDFKTVLTNIASSEPDLLYFPISVEAGSIVTRQAQETPGLENTTLMSAEAMFSSDIVERAGEAVEGLYVSGPYSSAFSDSDLSDFVLKYSDKFGTDPPNISHAYAYDAFMLIVNAIEKVATLDADGTLHIPRQALREALYATKDSPGLTGNLSCTPTGDCADPVIAIYEYHAGEFPPERIWP